MDEIDNDEQFLDSKEETDKHSPYKEKKIPQSKAIWFSYGGKYGVSCKCLKMCILAKIMSSAIWFFFFCAQWKLRCV